MSRQAAVESREPPAPETRPADAPETRPTDGPETRAADGPAGGPRNGRAVVCLVHQARFWREAADLAARLSLAGHSFILPMADRAAPTEATVESYLDADPESVAAVAFYDGLQTHKQGCLMAARQARCVVLLEPSGPDGAYLGAVAQAAGVPVILYGRDTPCALLFDATRAKTEEVLLEWVERFAATPLVRTGQGDGTRDWSPKDDYRDSRPGGFRPEAR